MKTTKEMIEVMEAYANGKEIEMYLDESDSWIKVDIPEWNWGNRDYRIKTKPTRLEVANKFWKDIGGVSDRFNIYSCPVSKCCDCPGVPSCDADALEKWWNTPMEGKGDKE